MVYGTSQSGMIGGSDWIFFNNIPLEEALVYAPTIPGITFASYVMMLAVVTPDNWCCSREDEMERIFGICNSLEHLHLLSPCALGLGKRRMVGPDRRL